MLPALLAHDVQRGLEQFLVTGFEPSDAFFHGVMKQFVDDASSWLKGPYLQIGLPFRPGVRGKSFFETFELQFAGYTHQELACERLQRQRAGANTRLSHEPKPAA